MDLMAEFLGQIVYSDAAVGTQYSHTLLWGRINGLSIIMYKPAPRIKHHLHAFLQMDMYNLNVSGTKLWIL